MTNSLISEWVGHATEAVNQVEQWPFSILLLAALIIFGGVLKLVAVFPNKWIPVAVLGVGAVVNATCGSNGSVGPDQNPVMVLAMRGFVIGFAAWTLHALLIKRFEKWIPILAGKTGDTETTPKP